ncbi:MAG TPA: sensor histidine kinase, partial [Methyloceanibacter sp.]|nr:sensor histidine kinase [Methyloceanibacter sp.]
WRRRPRLVSKLGHASQYRYPALRARPLLGLAVALGVFLLRYAFGGELYNVPFITAGERLFESAQGRLDTMARIHRRLYSPDTVDLPVHEFFQGLCQDILAARSVQNVKRLVKASHVTFDLERLIPLGLLLNELVTNSAKHAFSENAGGTISVTLEQQDEKLLALTVKDDGHGLPQGIDVANGRSLGLRIMNGLAVQLGGELSWIEQERGTSVRLVFPRGLVDRVEPEQAGTVSTERLTLSSRAF